MKTPYYFLLGAAISLSLPLMAEANEPVSSAEVGDAGVFHAVTFDNGITFGDPKGKMSLGLRFRMQNRADFIQPDSGNFEHEWYVRRARLRMNGHVVNPKLRYLLQLSFSMGDQDWYDSNQPNVIRDAMITYEVNERWQVGFGQGKLPGNRQRVVSSGDQQFGDRSIVNAAFNLDRDFGFQTSYRLNFNDQPVFLKASITSGEGRNRSATSDGRFFYVGRVEWLPFGEFKRHGDYFESDLLFEEAPRLSVGYSLASMPGSPRENGTIGDFFAGSARRSQTVQLFDIVYKYHGLSVYGELDRRDATNPLISPASAVLVGNGLNLQVGRMVNDKSELAVRHSQVLPEGDSLLVHDRRRQWAFVFNHFFQGHRVKFQTEVGVNESVDKYLRLQMELGI